MRQRKQSTITYPIPFFMSDSSDHMTGKLSLTPVVTLSKNGGTFESALGSVVEIGNGWYKLVGNSTDRNTLGSLIIHAEASGSDTFDIDYYIVSYDPFTIIGSSIYTDSVLYPDANGDPLEGVKIECYSDSDRTELVDIQETDANGTFTFNLNPAIYYFKALKLGYTLENWSVTVT